MEFRGATHISWSTDPEAKRSTLVDCSHPPFQYLSKLLGREHLKKAIHVATPCSEL
jgi:hypothetical protein